MQRPFLTAEWKNLIMANYIIDPGVLAPYLPIHTELDTYNGQVYVSLVGFVFANTRLLGYRIPFHVNFLEVNLRFYIRHFDNGTWKRGVVFIKEIVTRHAIRIIANTLYNEKYCCMPMQNFFSGNETEIHAGYQWKYKGRWNKMEVIASNVIQPMNAGSEESFIAEHYWGYSRFSEHITYEYEVQHPAWHAYPVKNYTINCDFEKLYGKEFAFLQTATPNSVFLAEGSPISVLNKRLLRNS